MSGSDRRRDLREVVLDAADWHRYAEHLGLVEGHPARRLREQIVRAVALTAASGSGRVVVVLTRADRALLRALDQQDLDDWFARADGQAVPPGPV